MRKWIVFNSQNENNILIEEDFEGFVCIVPQDLSWNNFRILPLTLCKQSKNTIALVKLFEALFSCTLIISYYDRDFKPHVAHLLYFSYV